MHHTLARVFCLSPSSSFLVSKSIGRLTLPLNGLIQGLSRSSLELSEGRPPIKPWLAGSRCSSSTADQSFVNLAETSSCDNWMRCCVERRRVKMGGECPVESLDTSKKKSSSSLRALLAFCTAFLLAHSFCRQISFRRSSAILGRSICVVKSQ